MKAVTSDLKELVRSEIETVCKDTEDRLWKNGQEAFEDALSALVSDARKSHKDFTTQMDSLQEKLNKVSSEQMSLRSMVTDINNRVNDMVTSDERGDDGDGDNKSECTLKKGNSSSNNKINKPKCDDEEMVFTI